VKDEEFGEEFKKKMENFGMVFLKNIFYFEHYEKLIGDIIILLIDKQDQDKKSTLLSEIGGSLFS